MAKIVLLFLSILAFRSKVEAKTPLSSERRRRLEHENCALTAGQRHDPDDDNACIPCAEGTYNHGGCTFCDTESTCEDCRVCGELAAGTLIARSNEGCRGGC